MTDLTFYDAAFPPADPLATDGVCIYIGGDTFHVWTAEEIGMQPARYRLPIFVRSNPPGPGAAADVADAVVRLREIKAPKGTLVAWDMETAAASAYIRDVYSRLTAAGYKLIVYGSESTVRGNDNPDGLYWGADWTNVQHLHSGDAITQFVSFSGFDESLAEPGLPFWDTQPHKPPPVSWQEKMMRNLPTVKQGAAGADVRTVQALCGARGHPAAVDGAFGPATRLAVEGCQRSVGVTADGIVGQHTWTYLITGKAS